MSNEAAFLKAIAADPDDDTHRLVFADWLDEREDPRAAWVRDAAIFRWMGPKAEDPRPALIRALIGEDHEKCWDAEKVLLRLGHDAVPVLLDQAEREMGNRWYEIALLLAQFKAPEIEPSLPRIFEMLKDERDEIKYISIHALSNAGPAAAPALGTLRAYLNEDHRDFDARGAATAALGSMGPAALEAVPELVQRLWDRDGNAGSALAAIGPLATPLILANLKHLDRDIIGRAVWPLQQYGEEAADALREGLSSPENAVRWVASIPLARFDPQAALPHLIEMLRDEDLHERMFELSIEALGEMGEDAAPAGPALLEVMKRVGDEYAGQVAEILRNLGVAPVQASDVLAQLQGADPRARLRAMESLVHLSELPEEASAAILRCLRDDDDSIRVTALRLTARCPTDDHRKAATAVRRLIRQEQNADIRLVAYQMLGFLLSDRALAADMVRALADPAEPIRAEAAEVIAKRTIRRAQIDAGLRTALDDGSAWVRRQAIMALKQVDPVRAGAVPRLMELITEDPDEHVRKAIVGIVKQFEFTPDETVTVLRRSVHDLATSVVSDAIDEIGYYAEWEKQPTAAAAALPDLLGIIENGASYLRERAARALGRIGGPAIPALVERLSHPSEEVRRYAAEGLGQLEKGLASAVPQLLPCLKNTNGNIRAFAAEALGKVGPEAAQAVPQLRRLLRDEDCRVRCNAVQALGRIGPAAVVAFHDIKPLMRDEDTNVRFCAFQALRILGEPEQVVPLFRAELASENGRKFAIDQLKELGSAAVEAIPDLLEMMQNENVRSAATQALGTVARHSGQAAMALCEALKDNCHFVRYFAAVALGEMNVAFADLVTPALERAAENDANSEVRQRAAWSLDQLASAATVQTS